MALKAAVNAAGLLLPPPPLKVGSAVSVDIADPGGSVPGAADDDDGAGNQKAGLLLPAAAAAPPKGDPKLKLWAGAADAAAGAAALAAL
jgi:hypothetical protein